MYTRKLTKTIEKSFSSGRAIVILGARRVGKTTLIKQIIKEKFSKKKVIQFNCDLISDRQKLTETTAVIDIVKDYDIVYIDEAQKVENIGNIIKILVDHYKDKKIFLITGSSAINLQYRTSETLTGRKFIYNLYPFALSEIVNDLGTITKEDYKKYLTYGLYPEVINTKDIKFKEEILLELVNGYLYKDLLDWQLVRNSEIVMKLLQALALQIGSEVSYNELAQIVGIDKETVSRYVELLEQSFVIFRLPPFFTNKRKVISKLRKVYFWDLGVRNAILNNFLPIDLRNDVGHLWENFVIAERIKSSNNNLERYIRSFARTYDMSEVDLIEEKDGEVKGYEIKWSDKKGRIAPQFFSEIPNSKFELITTENLSEFLNKSLI
jgi:hypothetical protein